MSDIHGTTAREGQIRHLNEFTTIAIFWIGRWRSARKAWWTAKPIRSRIVAG
jgi:hypothetical protein